MKRLLLVFVGLLLAGQGNLYSSTARAEEDDLTPKVNVALEKGVNWLKSQQQADGSFPPPTTGTTLGSTAISLYALLKVGVRPDDPAVVKGFKYIRDHRQQLYRPPDTVFPVYTVSFLILALASAGEHTEVKVVERGTQVVTEEMKIKLSVDKIAWMKELHSWLLSVRVDYKGKKGTNTSWAYRADQKGYYDNSNVQIAVLALKAASMSGIQTPKNIWEQILSHFLESQEENGEKVKRVGITEDGKTGLTDYEDVARGWPYRPGEAARQTLIAAGVGSILICLSELGNVGNLQTACDKAVRDGIASLAANYDKPNYMIGGPYYFLYGAERVGVIAGVKNIGEHLWYEEGAAMLIEKQSDDGSWSELNASGKGFGPGGNQNNGGGPGGPPAGGFGKPGGPPAGGGAPGGAPGGGPPGGGGGPSNNASSMTVINTSLALLFLKKGTLPVKGKKYQDIIETGQKKEVAPEEKK